MEEIFSKIPPPPQQPLWKFPIELPTFLHFWGLTEPPTLEEIPTPSEGGVWIGYFLETVQYSFTIH